MAEDLTRKDFTRGWNRKLTESDGISGIRGEPPTPEHPNFGDSSSLPCSAEETNAKMQIPQGSLCQALDIHLIYLYVCVCVHLHSASFQKGFKAAILLYFI